MSQQLCDSCGKTGLLSASIVKDEKTNERHIEVEVCENHTGANLAMKSVEALLKNGKMPVMVL